jgi:hypothetical protein
MGKKTGGRVANLRPFKKGEPSANPLGRPPDKLLRPYTSRLKALSEETLPEDLRLALKLEPGATYADAVIKRLMTRALKGEQNAMREIMDRMEGTPKQTTEISTPADRTFNIRVVYDKEPKK